MKLGAEKKGEVIALVVLLAVAAVLLWRTLLPAASAEAPAATVGTETRATRAASGPVDMRVLQVDPTLHLDKLERLRSIRYGGTGRNLFRFGPAPPTPAERAAAHAERQRQQQAQAAIPAGPPPPPPIPLQFYGFAQPSGGPTKIFLQMGADNFVVTQGEVVKHRYQIENIGKVSVRVKDLQTQSEQELPLAR